MPLLFSNLHTAYFDLDGTLVTTHIDFPSMKLATLQLAQRFNVNTNSIDGRDVLGIVENGVVQLKARQGKARAFAWRSAAFEMLATIEGRECANPEAVEGASDLLGLLVANGVRVCIVTRNCRKVATALAATANLPHHLLLSRDDVRHTKPHPQHLTTGSKLLGTQLDAGAAIVGDHWMDVMAGNAVKIGTVGLLLGRDKSFYDAAQPNLLVNTMSQLLALAFEEMTAARATASAQ